MSLASAIAGLPAHSSSGSHGVFTCLCCQIQFPSAELQRVHMKTEWHRYNLKRRVAELPPVTSEVFEIKVIQQRAKDEQYDEFGFRIVKSARSGRERRPRYQPRSKGISSNNELRLSPTVSVVSHDTTFSLGTTTSEVYSECGLLTPSSNGTDTEGYYSTGEEYETDEDEERAIDSELEENLTPEEIPVTTCFYCGEKNHEIETNIRHMFKRHGLYIPERSYLVDVEGLLKYISESVAIDHFCLTCGFVGKNLESIRQHLNDRGHCILPYETKEDRELVSTFYDFDVTLEVHSEGSKKSVSFAEGEDDVSSYTSSSTSSYTRAVVDDSGTQLILPNGVCLGNRRYARYYRQDIPSIEDKPVTEGERTVATIYAKADEVNRLGERLRKQEAREMGVIESRNRSRALTRKLKKCNNVRYMRDDLL
ncbi:DEKNAAC101485 [Brettanomyces naardenensis]|uniref:DEKNAAC101485 n=1 Tax=Brettanomyces naardenensis TaxID=13370 RepID=A0A448YI83_BRENA|nr:DEKNAAC101485 [Brettanomyces naardenensis]